MAKRGGFPGGMPGNMNNIMKQAQKMQNRWRKQPRSFTRSRRFLHSPCQRLQADLAEWEAASRFKPLRSSHGLLQQSN